ILCSLCRFESTIEIVRYLKEIEKYLLKHSFSVFLYLAGGPFSEIVKICCKPKKLVFENFVLLPAQSLRAFFSFGTGRSLFGTTLCFFSLFLRRTKILSIRISSLSLGIFSRIGISFFIEYFH